jgi:hypothetical protein
MVRTVEITIDELVAHFPCLYHMAELGTWPSIKAHGLLSTSALLDLYGVNGEERQLIECCRRPESVTIRHDKYGPAVIRDQKPMSDSALRKCLRGMTPTEWYRLLNAKVFFWLTPERVLGLLSARAYRDREHTVLIVDTAELLNFITKESLCLRLTLARLFTTLNRVVQTRFRRLRHIHSKDGEKKGERDEGSRRACG